MKRLKMFLTGLLLVFASTALYAQTEIAGNVTDEAGEPVIGATVVVKGTTDGTITDLDGNFKLSVEEGKTLIISYIGFENAEVTAAQNLRITLKEEVSELDEIVVTGYSVQKKADLTGAVSVVKTDDIAKQNENNPLKAMQGRVPGMNISADGSPSGSATVRIRGIGTLNNNDPLYIIDGVPTKSGMHELNGNDIESIQVLKDAASASIYGSRAANGVIIIT
ncbi:MAG: TonB-dependent receptor plug domain-containing protein, partial [Bacteroidales bacterium]|nr:TonB-dependent receptor plug domain-containing protein [Bacteroidales bacterium]